MVAWFDSPLSGLWIDMDDETQADGAWLRLKLAIGAGKLNKKRQTFATDA
jgi:hypothetical protein